MSPQARAVIAIVCLAGGIALLMVSALIHDPSVAVTGTALTGPVIGYAFGDRNGEKRAASALAERGLDPAVLGLLEQAVRPKGDSPSSSSGSSSSPSSGGT